MQKLTDMNIEDFIKKEIPEEIFEIEEKIHQIIKIENSIFRGHTMELVFYDFYKFVTRMEICYKNL